MNNKLLVFHPALAPYRIDFFNELSNKYDSLFYFSNDNLTNQKFNQLQLRKECKFNFNLIEGGFSFKNRDFRFGIFNIIKLAQPDIVICSEYSQITFSVILFKFFFNSKFKLYTLSDDSIELSISRNGIRKLVRMIAANFLDGIIFPSSHVSNWYNYNVNKKIKTLELPIIHDNLVFREKLFKALEVSNDFIFEYDLIGKKVFLFVGRLVNIKNVDNLIRSFACSLPNNNILIIIGEGEELQLLKDLVKKLKIQELCLFLGRLEGEKLLAWYNIAQCLVLPSYKEPYGAVVNEALLAGCKVICSEKAGASSLINSQNGLVFDPNSMLKLTNCINEISKELNTIQNEIKLKPDLMPFDLTQKLNTLFGCL